jgi:hypothetical protein
MLHFDRPLSSIAAMQKALFFVVPNRRGWPAFHFALEKGEFSLTI